MVDYNDRTALLVVDLQNDFADPDGSLSVAGGREVVAFANREAERARAASALTVYSQDWHPEHTPHFQIDGGIWPVHCVKDTWGAAFVPGLDVAGPVIRKGADGKDGYSAFSVRDPETGEHDTTGLAALLKRRRIRRVVICGLATDYCVKETVLDARRAGLEVTVLHGGIRAVDRNPGDGTAALDVMTRAGATVA